MTQKKEPKKHGEDSQTIRILKFLLSGGTITPLQALRRFDCWSLSSRISDINRMKKYVVKSELIKVRSGKFVSRYSIPV